VARNDAITRLRNFAGRCIFDTMNCKDHVGNSRFSAAGQACQSKGGLGLAQKAPGPPSRTRPPYTCPI